MDGFADSVLSASEALGRIEKERELAISRSRAVIRQSKRVIHAVHTGEDASGHMRALDAALDEMFSTDMPEILLSGPVQDAMGEYAEAVSLYSVIASGTIPSASEMGVSAASWVIGIADCVGELRRVVERDLMDGDLDSARKAFGFMEEISDQLMSLDVPDAVAPIRRKQDIARGIMDRTRSDLAIATVMRSAGRR